MQLANPQHEAFAQHRAAGKSKSESARLADYSTRSGSNVGNVGARLCKDPLVSKRIDELTKTYVGEGNINPADKFTSKLSVVTNIVSIHKLAKGAKEYAVALQCQRTLAQIGGLLGDGTGTRVNNTVNISGMTPQMMNEALRQSIGALPASERKMLTGESPELADIIDAEVLDVDEKTQAD